MSEKTGMQIIEEILIKVETLERRFAVLEHLMKELLNKQNGFSKKIEIKPEIKIDANKSEPIKLETVDGSVPKTRVMGRIKNSNGIYVTGVDVKIFQNNRVIKETKSNRSGEWICFLPSGQYRAEYFFEKQVNLDFNVISGETVKRVAQP